MSEKDFTLSIETAVQGGSISLLQGMTELEHWIGFKEVSKSEDVLEEIKNILDRNQVKKDQLKRIVISKGPGSHTGVRIGTAVGIGLRKALDCELVDVSVLEAMLLAGYHAEGEIIIAVPVGRNQVCRQSFKLRDQKFINCEIEPQLSTVEDFLDFAGERKFQHKKKIIMHRKLYLDFQTKFKDVLREFNMIIDAGENVALTIGILGIKKTRKGNVSTPKSIRDTIFQSL
jgi:tRNA threonylcarbamoyl adenosine modification protein YeaZ